MSCNKCHCRIIGIKVGSNPGRFPGIGLGRFPNICLNVRSRIILDIIPWFRHDECLYFRHFHYLLNEKYGAYLPSFWRNYETC